MNNEFLALRIPGETVLFDWNEKLSILRYFVQDCGALLYSTHHAFSVPVSIQCRILTKTKAMIAISASLVSVERPSVKNNYETKLEDKDIHAKYNVQFLIDI